MGEKNKNRKTYMLWLQKDEDVPVEKELAAMIQYAESKYTTHKNILVPKSLSVGDMIGEYQLQYVINCPPQHFMLEIDLKDNISSDSG